MRAQSLNCKPLRPIGARSQQSRAHSPSLDINYRNPFTGSRSIVNDAHIRENSFRDRNTFDRETKICIMCKILV